MSNETTEHLTEEEIRLQKIEKLKEKNINPYAYTYTKTHNSETVAKEFESIEVQETSEKSVSVAGRIIAKRGHGKAFFGNLKDEQGSVQFYCNINILGEEPYAEMLNLDVGDIIGVTGNPFRTKRGQLSIKIKSYELLTKTVHPLPEKFHGLQDKEQRYRQRYVDLIANDSTMKTFKTRSQVVKYIRQYLDNLDFMEVETPVLQTIYGGAAARPFSTHHNELDQNLYLRISLELYLKRLIVGGFERIYEIGRVFRNEGVSYKHNPEYTLLELYQAYTDYEDIMELTENIVSSVIYKIHGTYEIDYQGTMLNFKPPFQRVTLNDALENHAGVNLNSDLDTLKKKAKTLGLEVNDDTKKGQLLNFIYDKEVEHHLIQPTFIMDYPWETSPLAKRKRDDNQLVERFELIIHKMEVANAFSELNDPIEQHARFVDQIEAKKSGDDEAHEMDEDYVTALKYGMPPTGGLGIGIDRVVMLATNESSIRDVLCFPHMKTK
ncbi:lysine--tRNA ligase [bacterium]|jgi:lysyl-tRNA synthetase, class II|nr:lysine--tRNA ligase [bacterium]